jgi:hypothetical protein
MAQVHVRIIKGINISVISITGSVDPYVTVTTGHDYNWHNKTAKTKHIPKNKNPVWDQTFCFVVKNPTQDFVQVTVWDRNVGTNQMIGQGKYLLQNLTNGVEEIVQVPVTKGKKTTGVIEMGLKAINFGKQPPQVIHTHTSTTTTYAPQPTAMVAMQPAMQPMPVYTNVQQTYAPPAIQQTTYTQPAVQQTTYTQPAPQYAQTTVDNNMYAAYSGMLYGTNTPSAPPQMVPEGQPVMVAEGQPVMVAEGQPIQYFPPANEVYPGYPSNTADYNQGVPMGGMVQGTVDNNVQYYNPNVVIQQ